MSKSEKSKKISAFKKRIKTWSKSTPSKFNPKNSADVIHHYAIHEGMVSMAKEVQEFLDLLDEK